VDVVEFSKKDRLWLFGHGMRILAGLILLSTSLAVGQVNRGEVRLKIIDPSGAAVRATVELISIGNGYDHFFRSDADGDLAIHLVPYGVYKLEVKQAGFASFSESLEVRSALPADERIRLGLEPVSERVEVKGTGTLIDPELPSEVMQIGAAQIQERLSSLPGRSLQDLVISQPGWLYEGNAVLHARGSEYQTQLVVDGIPLTDNRSPSFGPEIEADNLDSISIYTAGYPAEFGREMGGVVELNTRRETDPGLHGDVVLSGGSYETASGYAQLQELNRKNTYGATSSGSMTSHYLNPVVPENYTNRGTTGDFSARYERDLAGKDLLILSARRELSRFLIPNEQLQEDAQQVQSGDNFESIGTITYQHIASPESLIALAGMIRENSKDLYSNQNPTPIAAFQHNYFHEGYFKGAYSFHHGHHEFKTGLDSDSIFLHENFHYVITDPAQFEAGTPASLSFLAQRPDLEQSAFVEDMIHVNNWTVSAGLRWDHYQLVLNRTAFSPRLSIGRYLPSLRMVLHGAYDRIFQTPSFENILISSSPEIDALSGQFLRLPVQPSKGSYYEGGLTESVFDRMRVDVNVYRRDFRNYADDDQLLNTGVSYPIAFDKAVIYGAEGKLEVVDLRNLSGVVSYSYMVGNAWFPVTGGLFLGDDASNASAQLAGHFPDSQDQRNTLQTRIRYSPGSRVWFAGGTSYGSGLPFRYTGNEAVALAEYGPEVISRINFARDRVRPTLAANASFGVNLCVCDRFHTTFQVDGDNLNNRLNVIDFGGLFSGNAIGPARSFALRLNARF
jgi:hypothetical protein